MIRAKDYRPRISVDLSVEQAQRLREVIPWGSMSKTFNIIVDDLIEIMEIGGTDALAALQARRLKLAHYLKTTENELLIEELHGKGSISAGDFAKLTGQPGSENK